MQPSRGVSRKRYSENMQQIYRRTPMSKCDLNLLHIFSTPFLKNTSVWLLLNLFPTLASDLRKPMVIFIVLVIIFTYRNVSETFPPGWTAVTLFRKFLENSVRIHPRQSVIFAKLQHLKLTTLRKLHSGVDVFLVIFQIFKLNSVITYFPLARSFFQ